MAATQPSYATSYPNSQTASNPWHCPPRQTQQHPHQAHTHQHQSQPTYNRNVANLGRLIMAIIIFFILITAIGIITWLILHPQAPLIRIDSLSISNFNLSDSQLSADFEVGFNVQNPNKKINLEFESLQVFVSYKKKLLSMARVRPFEVRKMNQTRVVKVELGTDSSYACGKIKGRTAIVMGRDWRQRVISLNVRMVGLATFKASNWLTRHNSIDVLCSNLEVGFGSHTMTGKLMGTGRKEYYCSVYIC